MNKQEINIYREIQRNTEMAMKALDAVTDKIYDDRLAATVADQEMQYSRLHDRAVQNLVEGKAQTYRENAMENMMLAASAVGVGSCWINRAMELFDRPEGKELLKKWGLPETCRGVGNCILGYVEGDLPAPKPRKDGWILRV